MSVLLAVCSILLLTGILGIWIVRIQPMLGPTTLSSPGGWFLIGGGFWIIVGSLELWHFWVGTNDWSSVISRAHYFSVTLMLAPLVCVLGAKASGNSILEHLRRDTDADDAQLAVDRRIIRDDSQQVAQS